MAFVSGNSESVRQLKDVFGMTMDKIEMDMDELEKNKKYILEGWSDGGAEELEEIITDIKKALHNAADSRSNIEKALENYAVFLEQK